VYSFTKMPRLTALNLAENNIAGIYDRSFQDLESLQYLDISNNKLPYIGYYTFGGCSKTQLNHLDLSFNLITALQTICFR
jgi:Leucine-rich repeat (LRR) protein